VAALFVVWSATGEPDNQQIIPIARLSLTPERPLVTTPPQNPQLPVEQRRIEPVSPPIDLADRRPQPVTRELPLQPPTSPLPTLGDAPVRSPFAATFYGTGGNARRIAYVVDASGSLIDTLDYVLAELRRSIDDLSDRQSFTVIFFQGDRALEAPPAGLKPATPAIKRQVEQWFSPQAGNVRAAGITAPQAALRLALHYEPQLIFLLSDSITSPGQDETDQRQLLQQIRQMNTSKTKINTIQFLYPDPLAAGGARGTLELIAEQTGGVYRFVSGRDVGIGTEDNR